MAMLASVVGRAPRLAVTALVLSCGVLPANADDTRVRAALERSGHVVLSGVQGCGSAFNNGLSRGSQCLVDWVANRLLLGTATRLATEQGRAAFGEHFRIVNTFSYAPSGSGLSGGVDVLFPLLSSTDADAAWAKANAFFFQQGVTRWVDEAGANRNDLRIGAVRRFSLSDQDALAGVVGVSLFLQQSLESHHTRLVTGADYLGKWGQGSLHLFVPTTGWRPDQAGYEERALAGTELGLRMDLTTTVTLRTAIGQWEDADGLGTWSTTGRLALGWRPHPWLDLGVAWNGVGRAGGTPAVQLAFSMPLGETRQPPPAWEGLGLSGGGPRPSTLDLWSPVENIDVIQVARRETRPAPFVAQARVRFLQASAPTGDEIGLEVRLPAVTPRTLRVLVTLVPGPGANPAVPGLDYVDAPVPVTIYAGTSSRIVTVQLPDNAALTEARSLGVTVSWQPDATRPAPQ